MYCILKIIINNIHVVLLEPVTTFDNNDIPIKWFYINLELTNGA